jgi:hypothetical protein
MTWTDFDEKSALERDTIERALPLTGDGSWSVTIDLATGGGDIVAVENEPIGLGRAGCIDLLRIRPLLVGAAWKVVDLLLEAALAVEAKKRPNRPPNWSISEKVRLAKAREGQPMALSSDAWVALTSTYVRTVLLRYALVHGRAFTDEDDALVGTDDEGKPLRRLIVAEQEALARSALRAAERVTVGSFDDRVHTDLIRHLGVLSDLHGQRLPDVRISDSLPVFRVIVDAESVGASRYVLDVLYLLDLPQLEAVTSRTFPRKSPTRYVERPPEIRG